MSSFIFAGLVSVEMNYFDEPFNVVPIVWANVVCNGNENILSECSYNEVAGDPICDHSHDIFINCASKMTKFRQRILNTIPVWYTAKTVLLF